MKKVIFQGLVVLASFLVLFIAVRQLDWMKVLKIEKVSENTEEKLGKIFLDIFKNTDELIDNKYLNDSIDSLIKRISERNLFGNELVSFTILNNEDVNAFALPGSEIVIYSGLLGEVENQEELCGIIAHEMAHIELNHVMKKLAKELGFSVLISITTGNGNGDVAKNAARLLSSTAFDRKLEAEADAKAVDYLVNAGIDAEPFANFLFRISTGEPAFLKGISWINSHPDSEERARTIAEAESKRSYEKSSPLSEESWRKFKEIISETR